MLWSLITGRLIGVQFFVSQPDADVERLLKFFTFLPITIIHEIMTEHVKTPEKRIAQHRLAREFVELVHGPEEADGAELQHRSMFSRSQPKIGDILTGEPDAMLPLSMVLGKPFPAILWNAGLVGSKSEGSRLVKKKGAYVLLPSLSEAAEQELSFSQIEATSDLVQEHHILDVAESARRTVILRSGKRKVCVVEIVSDEEFEKSGLDAPGWNETGSHH
jgi:tyrosyl-tRNA synthetase